MSYKKPKLKSRLNSSLISGSAVYVAANLIGAVTPFFLLPILTRYLPPSEYGEIAIFLTTITALSAIVGLNAVGAINRKYFDVNATEVVIREYIAACIHIILLSSLVTLAFTFYFSALLSKWLNIEANWIYWSVFVCTCIALIAIRLGQWQVRKQALRYGALQVSQSALLLAFTLLLVIGLNQGAEGRLIAQIISSGTIALAALYFLMKDRLLELLHFDKTKYKEILLFGVPLIPHSVGIFLLSSADRIVINDKMGIAGVGIYMAAAQVAGILGLLFDAINNAYVPWLYEKLQKNCREENRKIVYKTYQWFAFLLVVAGSSFLFGPMAFRLLVDDDYHAGANLIGWLVLGHCFNGMYLMVTNYIFYSKRTGMLSLVTVFSGGVNIALMILLIPLLGLEGVVISFSLTMCLRFLLTWWVAQRRHPMPWFYFKGSVSC